ncbi:Uncharacterized protein FWK35_00028583 [Aphis craccivora]|uniref:MULE domain-containing protein n=1 Tax=Aphis craccivora TaxID=307492 RepID=A0A6G0VNV0_APHCR|nr:Uncharacterized protein FWK35_00028583 [Aphis craccivora]
MLFDNIPCGPHEVPCPLRRYTHALTVSVWFVVYTRLRDALQRLRRRCFQLILISQQKHYAKPRFENRTPPLFPPSTWNVFELTKAGIGRTNNISEGWNNKFATLVRINHPNIWLFIKALQMSHSRAFSRNISKDDSYLTRIK